MSIKDNKIVDTIKKYGEKRKEFWEQTSIKTLEGLKQYKAHLNSPEGALGKLKQALKLAPGPEKAAKGKELKELTDFYENQFSEINEQIKAHEIQVRTEKFNADPYATNSQVGGLHPLTLVVKRLEAWFSQNGYFTAPNRHIISDELNFQALNIAKDHPARDMQDSLYFNENLLLRTHNTGWSAQQLKENVNKAFSHYTIGPVYRKDEDDQTHSHQFSQLDFVSVGNVTFNNLIATLKSMLSYVMEEEVEVRLRPSYFPFTEPSCEVDMFYKNRWVEILGSGMLHPNVMEYAGYTNGMNAIAAGIGIERLAMIKFNIEDIRNLYTNDLRFLKQF